LYFGVTTEAKPETAEAKPETAEVKPETAEVKLKAERAAKLFLDRWQESLETTFPSRRARTLSAGAAVEELLALADSWVRSGGVTKPAATPADGGHGVAMLPDVVDEALGIVKADPVLEARQITYQCAFKALIPNLKQKNQISAERVLQLKVLFENVRRVYIDDGFATALNLIGSSPENHDRIERVASAIVSELRAIGWSDEGLKEVTLAVRKAAVGHVAAVGQLQVVVSVPRRNFVCYVSVTIPQHCPPLNSADPTFSIVESIPEAPNSKRPLKGGPYARVCVVAYDPMSAGTSAYRRVLSTLGAVTLFMPGSGIGVASEVVGVAEGESVRSFDIQERLPEEKRSASAQEVNRILGTSWRASSMPTTDPLHDAIRLRHRAMLANDPESRLLLLWSGLERLTAGARGYDAALSAARELISRAVALGKVRRDIGDLAAVLMYGLSQDRERLSPVLKAVGGYADKNGQQRIDRNKLLGILLADRNELNSFVAIFETEHPLLAHRCRLLWKDLGGDKTAKPQERGGSIAEYYRASQQRVAWQVARIYRARNRIAHVGVGPERMKDLVWHAHFYLTQLVGICVHHGERHADWAQDVLIMRAGQYEAFLKLLEVGEQSCLTPHALIRPSLIFGQDSDST
jgi:hypothetical protein